MQVVEMEHEDGGRFWSRPLEDHEVTEYIGHWEMLGYSVSDIDEAAVEPDEYDEPLGMTDVEADADTLASAGWGTDEDYGYFGEDDFGGEW